MFVLIMINWKTSDKSNHPKTHGNQFLHHDVKYRIIFIKCNLKYSFFGPNCSELMCLKREMATLSYLSPKNVNISLISLYHSLQL
jgi:hypothetical protein